MPPPPWRHLPDPSARTHPPVNISATVKGFNLCNGPPSNLTRVSWSRCSSYGVNPCCSNPRPFTRVIHLHAILYFITWVLVLNQIYALSDTDTCYLSRPWFSVPLVYGCLNDISSWSTGKHTRMKWQSTTLDRQGCRKPPPLHCPLWKTMRTFCVPTS